MNRFTYGVEFIPAVLGRPTSSVTDPLSHLEKEVLDSLAQRGGDVSARSCLGEITADGALLTVETTVAREVADDAVCYCLKLLGLQKKKV
jgi:hypothetical protein